MLVTAAVGPLSSLRARSCIRIISKFAAYPATPRCPLYTETGPTPARTGIYTGPGTQAACKPAPDVGTGALGRSRAGVWCWRFVVFRNLGQPVLIGTKWRIKCRICFRVQVRSLRQPLVPAGQVQNATRLLAPLAATSLPSW